MGGECESRLMPVVIDPLTDGLIDAMNARLSEGLWEQVAVLALALGDVQLAVLVEDIRAIALDAVAHPSGNDGVIQGGSGDHRY